MFSVVLALKYIDKKIKNQDFEYSIKTEPDKENQAKGLKIKNKKQITIQKTNRMNN